MVGGTSWTCGGCTGFDQGVVLKASEVATHGLNGHIQDLGEFGRELLVGRDLARRELRARDVGLPRTTAASSSATTSAAATSTISTLATTTTTTLLVTHLETLLLGSPAGGCHAGRTGCTRKETC